MVQLRRFLPVMMALMVAVGAQRAQAGDARAAASKPAARPKVQIALLLDNSGSMSGLLNQARSELWTLIEALQEVERGGVGASIEVALYSYGDPPARQLVPFTTDLDKVSEALFALGISGGSEYAGEAIDVATRGLQWSSDPHDLKLIFVAGNEPFSQGQVPYRDAIKRALDPAIAVSTIHCGPLGAEAEEWRGAAALGQGAFSSIDHNAAVVHVATPFDKEIADLGVDLNGTYMVYGVHGAEGSARQAAQDMNALGSGLGIGTRRSLAKASNHYSNPTWDLVDAVKENRLDLATATDEQLPPDMRKLSVEERRAKVEAAEQRRAKLRARIAELNKKRQAFLKDAERATNAHTLDNALVSAVTELAQKKGYQIRRAGG
jgi:hypothetical protein